MNKAPNFKYQGMIMRNYFVPVLILLVGISFATLNNFASAEVLASLNSASRILVHTIH